MLRKPKLGIIGFSDGEPGVHEDLKGFVKAQVDAIVKELRSDGRLEIVEASDLVHSVATAKDMALEMVKGNVDGVIFSYGVFSFPNFSVISAQNLNCPVLLAANLNPDWPGMVSMLASGGALNQLGINHFRVAGDVVEPAVKKKFIDFGKAAYVVSSLNGSSYGLIGGRSLGMYSSTVSMQDWQKLFGVDVDHLDQSEIVRLAEEVDEKQVEKAFKWLTDNVKEIKYDGKQLTPEKLKTQIRHYEATKRIVKENNYDFIGVKCHYEMSRHYCTECMSAAFMNDPYDWDGPKEPVVFACEADSDAALTMQMLKLLTHDPVVFMDVRHWDAKHGVMVFCNCGSQSTYYADGSDDYKKNLSKVTLYPALDIYAGGGAHVNLMTKAGEATVARLCRREGKYRMVMFNAEFVELDPEVMKETTEEWPHVFAKLPFDHSVFLDRFDANHCHAVYGNHIEDLKNICKILDIEVDILE
ncbi:MAG: L-fucose/L-arabinose isomerase family protein [Sphaerochaetaceae bacterium]